MRDDKYRDEDEDGNEDELLRLDLREEMRKRSGSGSFPKSPAMCVISFACIVSERRRKGVGVERCVGKVRGWRREERERDEFIFSRKNSCYLG